MGQVVVKAQFRINRLIQGLTDRHANDNAPNNGSQAHRPDCAHFIGAAKQKMTGKRDHDQDRGEENSDRQTRRPTLPCKQSDTGQNIEKPGEEVEPQNERHGITDCGARLDATKEGATACGDRQKAKHSGNTCRDDKVPSAFCHSLHSFSSGC